jgi:hypothetical protein
MLNVRPSLDFRAGRKFGQELDVPVIGTRKAGLLGERAAEVAQATEGADDRLHGEVASAFGFEIGARLSARGQRFGSGDKSTGEGTYLPKAWSRHLNYRFWGTSSPGL